MHSPDLAPSVLDKLASIVGKVNVLVDPETLELYSRDIWKEGRTAAAVVRPGDTTELAAVASETATTDTVLVGRGGGMSYTRGYTQDAEGAMIVCTRRLNQVLELNKADMTVTVQAGCTWADLHEGLRPSGLRTPYWGPLSGRYATVGGSVSQNSIFWGGSRHGCAADSVVSMSIVLANGEILQTGVAAQRNAAPFYRHFGPDLTGLFCCDCGALGIKAEITLRLIPEPSAREYLSFDFPEHPGLLETMAEINRRDLASECFGFDPLLTEMRAQRDSLMADAKSLGKVVASAGSLRQAAADTLGILAGGRRFMKSLAWPLHVIVEERTGGQAAEMAGQVRDIAGRHGGKEVSNSIPKIMRSNPFGPVNNMIGPGGERWVPVHGLVALSAGSRATEVVQEIFENYREPLDRFGIRTGFLYNTVAGHCMAVEPLFFWPDCMESIHRESVEPEFYRSVPKLEKNLEARALVADVRQVIADAFRNMGASHLQIGRTYHYADALEPPALQLVKDLKAALDPAGRINPGVLGLD